MTTPLTRAQVDMALQIAAHELALDEKPNASKAVDDAKASVEAIYDALAASEADRASTVETLRLATEQLRAWRALLGCDERQRDGNLLDRLRALAAQGRDGKAVS